MDESSYTLTSVAHHAAFTVGRRPTRFNALTPFQDLAPHRGGQGAPQTPRRPIGTHITAAIQLSGVALIQRLSFPAAIHQCPKTIS